MDGHNERSKALDVAFSLAFDIHPLRVAECGSGTDAHAHLQAVLIEPDGDTINLFVADVAACAQMDTGPPMFDPRTRDDDAYDDDPFGDDDE